MAGVTPQQQQVQAPQQQVLTQQLQTTTTTTPEEEFLKRNTDCVYFLASPLTCKKGSECEYRHSDIARVNPRDCWYWLNGNCLNPKCAFRHPPLDGLLGAEVPAPMGPPVPQLQTSAVPAAQVPYVPGKQGVPCIFFQKGYCLKGDRCPFLHPPSSGSSKVAQSATVAPVTELPTLKKTFGDLEKCTREQKVLQANVQRSVELPPQRKPLARVEVSAMRNGVVVDKTVPTMPSVLGDNMPRYRPHSVPPATNEILNTRSNRMHQAHISDNDSILNGKDGDEFSREPSPGFDVLVDDELRDSDYYHSEEQFGRPRGHDGRNMNPMNDYNLGRPSDFHSMADVERDMYRDPRDFDSYDRMQGHYGWEEQRRSSERMLGGSGHGERRRYPRDESPDQVDGLDLRHRISKQKRGNGLRSVVSREQTCESHAEDQNYRGGPRRENHLVTPHEGSLSSRLRGRIKLPGRSMSPVKEIDVRAERDINLGRHQARLSPSRPHVASSQGRLRDRIKGRVQEDLNDEGRDFRGRIRRDLITDNNTEFSAPKRLFELKSSKTAEDHELQMNERQSLGKRKYPKVESHQQSEDDLSFEGPKPLSEILKRKRGSESAASESGISAGYNNVYNKEKDGKESMIKSTVYDSNKEESYSASGEAGKQVPTEEVKAPEVNEEEIEEGMIGDDAMEDHDLETYDQREEDFDYEQVDGEDYNLEGGENVEAEEEEYLDEEDGDDFAKKMGVVFS